MRLATARCWLHAADIANLCNPKQDGSGYFKAKIAFVLITQIIAGCSLHIPERELSIGYAAERGGTERHVIGGLNLRFGGRWPGVHAGLEDTTVSTVSFTGTNRGKLLNKPAQFAPPLALTWIRSGVVCHAGWFYRRSEPPMDTVQFIGESKLGLGVNWHPSARSLDFGYSRQTLLIAPARTEGVFLINFDSRHTFKRPILCSQTNYN